MKKENSPRTYDHANPFEDAPLGEKVFNRSYRHGGETWHGAVSRIVNGNCNYITDHVDPGKQVGLAEYDILKNALLDMKILLGGRHLFMSGFSKYAPMNCFRAGWSSYRDHFTFMFDSLLLGGGVGANYSEEYLQSDFLKSAPKIYALCNSAHPDFKDMEDCLDSYEEVDIYHTDAGTGERVIHYNIPDTREGWVEACRTLFLGYDVVIFDVSDVRGKGEPIKGFGGTASGPGPLIRALRKIASIMAEDFVGHGTKLSSMGAMRIDHALAEAVVAGNVRRSARMSIMHWADPSIFEFLDCKQESSEMWTTNISVEIDGNFLAECQVPGTFANQVYMLACQRMLENGEPGFYNSMLASENERGDVRSTNPCGEVPLEEYEACNLGSVNLARIDNIDELMELTTVLTRALYRATFAPFSNQRTQEIVSRNRRLGLGIMGLTEYAAKLGIKWSDMTESKELTEMLEMIAGCSTAAAEDYADYLGYPTPIKVNAIAPNGSISLLAGCTAGLNPVQHAYFLRRMRYADDSPELENIPDDTKEPCIYSANTTVVTSYHVDPAIVEFGETVIEDATQISIEDKLKVQAWAQQSIDNAISFTITVQDGEVTTEELANILYKYLYQIKGVTCFPSLARPQTPIEAISKYQFEEMHGTVSQDDELCLVGACPVN